MLILPWWGSGNHLLIIISFFSGLSPLPSGSASGSALCSLTRRGLGWVRVRLP
nr:MAG TPA: hypothetical protein [Caudoviricetes sp.]